MGSVHCTSFEIRGELYVKTVDFQKLAAVSKQVQTRNFVTGIVNSKQESFFGLKFLRAIVYEFLSLDEQPDFLIQSHINALKESLEFKTTFNEPVSKLLDDPNSVISFIKQFEPQKDLLEYEIDGLVVKANDFRVRAALGSNNKYPLYSFAFKYSSEVVKTYVKGVTYNVGKAGQIIPILIVENIVIKNVSVNKISLQNVRKLDQLSICLEDEVKIQLVGGIVPQLISINRLARKKTSQIITAPLLCPSCNHKLVYEEKRDSSNKTAFPEPVCYNSMKCPAQQVALLLQFVSKYGFNISSLG